MSFIWLVVVLHLLNGAYAGIRKRSATCPAKYSASVLSPEDEQLKALLNKQIVNFKATQPSSGCFYNESNIQINNWSIQLHSFTFENFVGKIIAVEPKLANQYMKAHVEWNNLAIKGKCTVGSHWIDGIINMIVWHPVAIVDINIVAMEPGTLKTSYVNLDFDTIPDSVNVTFDVVSQDLISIGIELNTSIFKYIADDLEWALEQSVQDQLNQILAGLELQDIFSNRDDAAKYKATNTETHDAMFLAGTLIVKKIGQLMEESLNSVINLPDHYIQYKGTTSNITISLKNVSFGDASALQMKGNSVETVVNAVVDVVIEVIKDVIKDVIEDVVNEIIIPILVEFGQAVIDAEFISRGDHIYGQISKLQIKRITVPENIKVDLTLGNITSPTTETVASLIRDEVRKILKIEVPNEMQKIINKLLPTEFPADELKDAVDKNIIKVKEG